MDPTHIIILLDLSGSVEQESVSDAFNTVDEIAKHLRRGDRMTIIPITSDAFSESSGRVLRFDVPSRRESYDADLTRFEGDLAHSLAAFRASSFAHPSHRTDILGAIKVAVEEDSRAASIKAELFIMSDFIQDDGRLNFKNDPRFADAHSARVFAESLAQTPTPQRSFRAAHLGMLRSNELHSLNPQRRQAIQVFWKTYLGAITQNVQFDSDVRGLPAHLQ